MKEYFTNIWKYRHTPQGRVDFTVLCVNLMLLLAHIFLMVIYIYVGHATMIIVNIASLLLYLSFLFVSVRNVDLFMTLTFFEIWFHMILAVLSFGWDAGFQNWTYALISAFFLPSFSPINSREKDKRPFVIGVAFILTYYILVAAINIFNIPILSPLPNITNDILFTFNTLISFATIILFAYFYTSRSNRRQNELSRRADYDELTSLYNRHALNQIGVGINMQSTIAKRPFNVAILDIDHFKQINDTYGHASGDDILKELANIIRSYSVRGITPGRWGGEEFVMVGPNIIEYDEFTNILEKMREKVEKTKFKVEDGKEINMTISIGSASVSKVKNLEEAVAIADEKLYKAKKTGRNKLVK